MYPGQISPGAAAGGIGALFLINFLFGVCLAYFIYSHALKKTGSQETAIGWGVATFVFGLIVVAIYFLLQSSIPTKQVSCPGCGKENVATAIACQYCGTRFVQEDKRKVCPSCGRSFAEEANFCPHCAVELKEREQVGGIKAQGEATKVCPSCQAVNLTHRAECHKCGHKFEIAG